MEKECGLLDVRGCVRLLSYCAVAATDSFMTLAPSPLKIINPKIRKALSIAMPLYSIIFKKKHPADVIGHKLGYMALGKMGFGKLRGRIAWLMDHRNTSTFIRKPHTWIRDKGTTRHTKRMIIVYHDANKARKHLDVHIGHLSLIYRISGKPIEKLLKFNTNGTLTQSSKDLLINHIKQEIDSGARVPQNRDHTLSQALCLWDKRSESIKGYGSGNTRQVVVDEKVEILESHDTNGSTIKLYSPSLDNKTRGGIYIHKLYPSTNNKAPILVAGRLSSEDPKLEDRLHLKMVHDINKFKEKVDLSTVTVKYDGASCYVVMTPKGTKVYSPRISKVTGRRIEYTAKVPGLSRVKTRETIKFMGELLYKNRLGKYLKAHEIGGILNSNSTVPNNVKPEIRLYRVDTVGRNKTTNLTFKENRQLCKTISSLLPSIIKLPSRSKVRVSKNIEGLVGVPKGQSINSAYKIKWLDDPADWTLTKVSLYLSDKGNVAGVVWFITEEGKSMKLGPGQIGDTSTCLDMMNNPKDYEGSVFKVRSRIGHIGRASILERHQDKGIGE